MSVPKLRFEEFQNSWKIFRLEEIASVERGKFSVRPRNDPKYFGGHLPFIQTGDVSNANIFVKNYSQTLNYAGIEVSRVFPEGTILITIAANIGDTAITQFQVACPDSLVGINPNTNITNTYFLKYVLDLSKETLDSQATQNAQKNINLQILRPLPCCLPVLEEQTKIATFLFAVDEKIAQLSRKHELLLQYKQGMMQQLFSQKLRFKDDKGEDFPEWEEKLLGNICSNFQSGKSITSDEIFEVGKYPVYGGNGLRGFTSSYTHEGTFVLIGRQGALCGNINLVNQKNFVSEHAIAVQAQKSFSNEWLAQLLTWMNLGRFSESSAQAGLAVNKLIKFKICCPTKLEQTKIANFLNAIDNKIDVITNQIQQAREWKQGLLQQMFV